MSNWCGNKLIVSGNKKDVEEFCEKICGNDTVLDFNKITPHPEHVAKADAEADKERMEGHLSGREWCCKNWGTKCNAWDVFFEDLHNVNDYNKISIEFFTAWSPAIPIIEKIIELFPKLEFDFEWDVAEMMCGGTMSGKNGKITGEGDWTYDDVSGKIIERKESEIK